MPKEYIEKKILEKLFEPVIANDDCSFATAVKIVETLDSAPVSYIEASNRGHWLLEREPDGKPYCLHCSICDGDFRHIDIRTAFPFCPHCVSDMNTNKVYDV